MNEIRNDSQGQGTQQQLYYQTPSPEDEINLFELFSYLFRQWKLIAAIITAGTLFSIIYALSIPKVYESHSSLRIPTKSQIAPINENGYNKYTTQQLFKRFFDQIKSKENLKNYLIQTNPFPKMIASFNVENTIQTASAFAEEFEFTILEPEVPKGKRVLIPELFEVRISSTTEAETVTVLNEYIRYIENKLIDEIKNEGFSDVSLHFNNINRDIQLLRKSATRSRELLIEKLTTENQEKLSIIQQKIYFLRTKTKENRLRLVEKMKASNSTKIETLKQQIALLKEKKKKEITSQSAHLHEAYQLAQSAGIKKPTTFNMLAASNRLTDVSLQTQINVNNNNKTLQFLLGTEHLSSQIDILKKRKDLSQFISKIPELESQIESLRNDTKIRELQNRISDDPYIDGLQDLMNQITTIENDKRIQALQSRKSDDPFIGSLPNKLNELDRLKQISFEFGHASLYKKDQAAAVDGVAESPNRKRIVVLGTLLSGILSLFIALIVSASQRRALRETT